LVPVLFVAAGCAHTPVLVPAPDAQRLPGQPAAAVASAGGVQVTVNSQRWKGQPSDLDSIVTPLHVAIENGGQAPIRIRYRDFTLTNSQGLQSAAIPPFAIQRPGSRVVAIAPAFPADRFLLLRPYGPYYPGVPLWPGPFDWDPFFYDQYYSSWEPSLPTPDMLNQALPEGVLQPGGRVAGFLYFRRISQSDGRVIFAEEVIDANTRERIATLRIPLLAK
jgi:hypothetical protein